MGFKSFYWSCLTFVISLAAAGVGVAKAEVLTIEGAAHVVDAATVEIWGQRIRLAGIAVPAAGSEEGESARRFLEGLLAGVRLRCNIQEAPFKKEMLGRCFVANVDVVDPLVQMGYARKIGDATGEISQRPNEAVSRPAAEAGCRAR